MTTVFLCQNHASDPKHIGCGGEPCEWAIAYDRSFAKELARPVEVDQPVLPDDGELEFITDRKLSADLRSAAQILGNREARFLVDTYYSMQKARIRAGNQIRATIKPKIGEPEPGELLTHLYGQNQVMESYIKTALDVYSYNHPMGTWLRATHGIGPIIAAGLLCHTHMEHCPTVGHLWAFAGLDPSKTWEKGQKRPWNASFKVVCYHLGESFIKFHKAEKCVYGHIWVDRKKYETLKNHGGDYRAQAEQALIDKNYDKKTDAYQWYSGKWIDNPDMVRVALAQPVDPITKKYPDISVVEAKMNVTRLPYSGPMLPPGHIHSRARRYTAKRFLSDWHATSYWVENNKVAPLPYPIAHLNHSHINLDLPENTEMFPGFTSSLAEQRAAHGHVVE